MSNQGFHVAVMGATGAVGQQILAKLAERNFPIKKLTLLSSARSAGTEIEFKGDTITVQEATPELFEGVDIALFSAGGSISEKFAQEAVTRGAIVIDNTSHFRMHPDVPLIVPEVNAHAAKEHKGIIANPNCSTIQMVAALQPIRDKYGINKIVVSTYQAVSGAGAAAINEMKEQSKAILNNEEFTPEILPVGSAEKHYQIAFNVVPQIDTFAENGYTLEEMKMINETKKIMENNDLHVAATCVRLPVETGHSESVYIEVDQENVSVEELQAVLADAPGITLQDDPTNQVYPMPAQAHGKDDIFVGRVRKDLDSATGFHLWVVSDNLLKGAALNTIQIAESLIEQGVVTAK